MHKRQQIRAAIVAALEATTTFQGRTYSTRLRTTAIDEMPVALVYTLDETSSHYDVALDLDRTVKAVIEIKAVATDDIADALDDLSAAAEAAMYADYDLGGLAVGLELVRTQIGLDGSGNAKDGSALLTFDIRYLTSRP